MVIDGDQEQQREGELGNPSAGTFSDQDLLTAEVVTLDSERASLIPMPEGRTLDANNANRWVVTASSPSIATGIVANLTPLIVALFAIGIPLTVAGLFGAFRARRRRQADEALVRAERDSLDTRIEDLSHALALAAAGDLSVTVDVDLGDERMTALNQAFDATLTHLRDLVAQAQASGERLA
ncbi:MAG: hypothetical protein LH645_13405 [Actinomycetia bacterium]|nr:hypothetical protein [Actinomycetes bacterium]